MREAATGSAARSRVAVSVVKRDRLASEAGVRGDDGDDAAGEEALVELPDVAVEVDRAVLADATAAMDGECGGERGSSIARQVAPAHASAGALPYRPPCGARW